MIETFRNISTRTTFITGYFESSHYSSAKVPAGFCYIYTENGDETVYMTEGCFWRMLPPT